MTHDASIAMARLVLAAGRTTEVRRMLEPLAAQAAGDEAVYLRALLAAATPSSREEDLEALAAGAPATGDRARAIAAAVRGRHALVQGEPRRALVLFQEAEACLAGTGDLLVEGWTLAGLAATYQCLGAPPMSAAYTGRARALDAIVGDTHVADRLAAVDAPEGAEDAPAGERPVAFSPAMQHVLAEARRLAPTTLPVLVAGASGTGRRYWARWLHRHGPHPDGPLVVTGPDGTSGASALGAAGDPVDRAAGGTLVLHDVDRMPADAQRGLSRRLASPEAPRLVATTTRPVAALRCGDTLDAALRAALAGGLLTLPLLHERTADLLPLIRHFLDALRPAGTPRVALTFRATDALLRYPWPGNARQLRHEVERALVYVSSEPAPVVDVGTLSAALQNPAAPDVARHAILTPGRDLHDVLAATERTLIERVLHAQDGQITASAEVLGLTRQGLYKKMKRLDIDAARFQPTPASA